MSDDDIIGYIIPDIHIWLSIIEQSKEDMNLLDLIPPKLPITDIVYEPVMIPMLPGHLASLRLEEVECYEIHYEGQKFILWPGDIDEIQIGD